MTWWGFALPVGTCVTGTAGLARHTGLAAYGRLATALYAVLVVAWAVAATGAAPRPAHRPPPRGPTDACGICSRAYLTARYRSAARSCPVRTVGAAANDGPYHVSCRPSTSAAGTPGKASGPSSAVKR